MSLILKQYFQNIIIATNGEEGLRAFKNNQIDIIITDLYMPKLNGIDMLGKIRTFNADVSIIIVTAYEELNYLRKSIKYSVADYLLKPIERTVLKKTLSKIQEKIIKKKKQVSIDDFIKTLNNGIVILIKIENFEYLEGYNHFHSNENIEKDFALKLMNKLPKACRFFQIYTLGNGEFALVKESNSSNIQDIISKMQKYQKEINRLKINMSYIEYDLSIIMSIAYGEEALRDAKLGLQALLTSKEHFIVANGLSIKHRRKSIRKIKIFKMIKKAIDSYNIVSYYQPIIENKTKKIIKYESLVRLIDEGGNVLSPHLFLDASKKGNYYAKITSMVLENSFKALKETRADISINLSALDIEREETRVEFFQKLQKHKSDAKRIILEFTEDENIQNFQLVKNFIAEIKILGVKIAIDDFGVGYSGFERVLDYKPDILKIDGRLIKNINKDKVAYSIVQSIVFFAEKENLETIAEYVDSKEVYNTVCSLGITYSQGYYFGKPDILSYNEK